MEDSVHRPTDSLVSPLPYTLGSALGRIQGWLKQQQLTTSDGYLPPFEVVQGLATPAYTCCCLPGCLLPHLQGTERTSSARLASSLGHNYDAVIGSLPKGLSVEERAKLAASLPMSPALGALASLPKVGWCRGVAQGTGGATSSSNQLHLGRGGWWGSCLATHSKQ